jgi:hypothetical protein
MDFACMADLICDDKASKRRMSFKEWLDCRTCKGVVTDPARPQREGEMVSRTGTVSCLQSSQTVSQKPGGGMSARAHYLVY